MSGAKLGMIATAVAIVLMLASSLCAVNCVAAENPHAPPCHRHAPSNAKACTHPVLTATEWCLSSASAVPAAFALGLAPAPAISLVVYRTRWSRLRAGPGRATILRI